MYIYKSSACYSINLVLLFQNSGNYHTINVLSNFEVEVCGLCTTWLKQINGRKKGRKKVTWWIEGIGLINQVDYMIHTAAKLLFRQALYDISEPNIHHWQTFGFSGKSNHWTWWKRRIQVILDGRTSWNIWMWVYRSLDLNCFLLYLQQARGES